VAAHNAKNGTTSFAHLRCLSIVAVSVFAAASAAHAGVTEDQQDELFMIVALVALLCLFIYIIPTIVAFWRSHPNRWLIAVINITLGGTELGWLGSLVWACSAVHRSPTGNHGGESGLNLFINDTSRIVIGAPDNFEEISDKLMRLKKLHEAGGLSDDEYLQLREPLIKSL
jgi:hypothetical protein